MSFQEYQSIWRRCIGPACGPLRHHHHRRNRATGFNRNNRWIRLPRCRRCTIGVLRSHRQRIRRMPLGPRRTRLLDGLRWILNAVERGYSTGHPPRRPR